MTSGQITADDIINWNSLDDIATSLEKRCLERHPDLGDDNRIVLELADGEFMELVEAGAGKSATDYKPGSVTRHTNLVSTDDFETFTFITRQRDWDAHGRIKYQQFSFEKEQFRSETGEKNTVLQKLNEIEYGQSAAVMDDLYDTRQIVKEFYEQFEALRTDLVQEVSGIPDDRGDAKSRYVQVLLDRMIFLYFIQEKNLLDYDAEYLHNHHQRVVNEGGDVDEDFYDPLFFEMLAEGKNDPEFGKLPYLNGGLFSKNPIEEEFEDAKLGADTEETNKLFDRILDFLSDWNWNVDERLDIVDPKNLSPAVLGHIFEQTVNQKEMGAYYTPEEITGFMTRRTIHPYLIDQLNEAEGTNYESIDDVFSLGAASVGENPDDEALADGGALAHEVNVEKIEQDHVETLYFDVLKDIRVLDPAVGSGAFLLAAQEVLIDVYLQCIEYFVAKEEKKPFELTDQIKHELETIRETKGNETLYAKRTIILNNLFGVDIDDGAVEICKLRLWLSMVADIEDEPQEVKPLPNIDFNIRQGNTLIGFTDLIETTGSGDKALTNWGGGIGDNVQEMYDDVIEAVNNHRNAESGVEAAQARKNAQNRINEHKKNLDEKIWNQFTDLGIDISLSELEDHHPFHWVLEFATVYSDGGFDVILGNPPYIRIQELKKSQSEIAEYLGESNEYSTPYYNYDIAIPFVERCQHLMNEDARLSFILTNKWLQARYGRKLRGILSESKSVNQLIDFTDQQVFEGISTYVAILSLTSESNDKISYGEVVDAEDNLQEILTAIDHGNTDVIERGRAKSFEAGYETLTENPWTFVPKEEASIIDDINDFQNLGEIADRIFVGIQTSKDDVYILDVVGEHDDVFVCNSDSLGKTVEIEKGIAKPLLKGSEFQKWQTEDHSKIVVYPYNVYETSAGFDADLMEWSHIETKYPNASQYLKANKQALEGRQGGDWEGSDDWYEFGRRQNVDQFGQTKIMTSVLNKNSKFSIDDGSNYVFVGGGNAGGYGVTLPSGSSMSYQYLLPILNSRLLEWYIQKISSQFRGGYYSYGRKYMEKLPIVDSMTPELYENLGETIIQLIEQGGRDQNEERIQQIERVIDSLVYDDYFAIVNGELAEYLSSTDLATGPVSQETIDEILGSKRVSEIISEIEGAENVSVIKED
jgi:type I restriction-modification system DNA methylase subunit